ncbi:hypothetical protein AALP_AA4G213500 [Arabis alpina]|uniref:Uncharacterized protein n=1 Tax=Arabis alpina TaxID=50452 RepID=A0A087H4Q2_ARAAL|nr:hypothetical protein AALP_AA4G213500 [Arabis alpina]
MAMSLSGAVLSGITTSFHSGGAKFNGVSTVNVGRKTNLLVVAHRKKSLIYAVQNDDNIVDDINKTTKEATDFVTEKTKEALKDGEKAKDYVVEKTVEAKDTAVEEAQKASEFVTEKAKEAAEFVEAKAGEAKDAIKS